MYYSLIGNCYKLFNDDKEDYNEGKVAICNYSNNPHANVLIAYIFQGR